MKFRKYLLKEVNTTLYLEVDPLYPIYNWEDDEMDDILGNPSWNTDKAADTPEADQEREGREIKRDIMDLPKNLLDLKTKNYKDTYSKWKHILDKNLKNKNNAEDSTEDLYKKKTKGLKVDPDAKIFHLSMKK
jgi:hypothetical protein